LKTPMDTIQRILHNPPIWYIILYHIMMEEVFMPSLRHDAMRKGNILSVLRCIRDYGPLAKSEIQSRTGLSWGAVSGITHDLLKERITAQRKSAEPSPGRTPELLEIGDEIVVLGLDINIEGITAVAVGLNGHVLESAVMHLEYNDRSHILALARRMITDRISGATGQGKRIVGIGMAIQGAVDVENGVSVFSPHFADWNNVPIRSLFTGEFGLPALVEHDPNCMALAEMQAGKAPQYGNFIFIRLSMGIGMSIITDGKVYRGATGSAGEFGHTVVVPGGNRCFCGKNGCLEAYSSGRSILARASGEGCAASGLSRLSSISGLEAIASEARSGNERYRNLFRESGGYLGTGLANLVNLFNPETIVLGGELVRCADLFLEDAVSRAKQLAWPEAPVNIRLSPLGRDAAAVGAAALFLHRVFMGELFWILDRQEGARV
jgi:N-acetylglucosamine repressor